MFASERTLSLSQSLSRLSTEISLGLSYIETKISHESGSPDYKIWVVNPFSYQITLSFSVESQTLSLILKMISHRLSTRSKMVTVSDSITSDTIMMSNKPLWTLSVS